MQWQWNVYCENKNYGFFFSFLLYKSLFGKFIPSQIFWDLLHLILKGNGKAPTKLNVLFIDVNSIKTPERLPASTQGIWRCSGTGCGSPRKGRELGLRIPSTSSQAQVPCRTRDIFPALMDPRIPSSTRILRLLCWTQDNSYFLLLWPCSWAPDYAVTQL